MKTMRCTLVSVTALLAGFITAPPSDEARVRPAIERSAAYLKRGATLYPSKRDCFSCHHQAMSLLTARVLKSRGFAVDEQWQRDVAQFSWRSFTARKEPARQGTGVGGQSTTVAYGLTALDAAQWTRDDTTDALVEFLLKRQSTDGSWPPTTKRPPTEGSLFTATALAVRSLRVYGVGERRDAAVARAREWLVRNPGLDTEDLAFRLFGLHAVEARDEVKSAAQVLLRQQRDDGGWAQLPELKSDAYATGLALVALAETGSLSTSNEEYQRGVAYLLRTQLEDGTWHVTTRSKPIQEFFDLNDPHYVDQFISFPATGWATMALAYTLPKKS